MKTYIFVCVLILLKIISSNEVNNNIENGKGTDENVESIQTSAEVTAEPPVRNFEKDMEDLDLSGYEDEIENVDELAKKPSYVYLTQIYVYVRIDGEYAIYKERSDFLDLGTRYMTVLQNAMLPVQLKITGIGEYTCFFRNKDMTNKLADYFLMQKEVDFIDVNNKILYPENRNVPITSRDERNKMEESTKYEDL